MILGKTYLGNTEIQKAYLGSSVVYEVSGITTEYQDILDEATLQGYTLPSAADQITQNQMIVDAKASGVWSKMDLLYIFTLSGGADFKKINWKNPTGVKITEYNNTVSPTYDSSGVQQPTGRSRLNLGHTFLSLTNYQQNSASYFIDVTVAYTSASVMLGSQNGSTYNYASQGASKRPAINNSSALPPPISNWTSAELCGTHRSSSTTVELTTDGVETSSSASSISDVKENANIFILGRQIGSISSGLGYDGKIGFFAIGGYMKSDAQNMIDAFRI
jgi:hypothetical protein